MKPMKVWTLFAVDRHRLWEMQNGIEKKIKNIDLQYEYEKQINDLRRKMKNEKWNYYVHLSSKKIPVTIRIRCAMIPIDRICKINR